MTLAIKNDITEVLTCAEIDAPMDYAAKDENLAALFHTAPEFSGITASWSNDEMARLKQIRAERQQKLAGPTRKAISAAGADFATSDTIKFDNAKSWRRRNPNGTFEEYANYQKMSQVRAKERIISPEERARRQEDQRQRRANRTPEEKEQIKQYNREYFQNLSPAKREQLKQAQREKFREKAALKKLKDAEANAQAMVAKNSENVK